MYLADSSAAACSAPTRVLDAVVLLEARLQALQDLDGLLDRRLDDVDLLEAPRQRRVLLEDAAVLGEGGRADALHRAAWTSAGLSRLLASSVPPEAAPAPISVWISSMNRIAFGWSFSVLQHALQALLEIAAVLGAGQQRAHVERVDDRLGQHLGHVALRDAPGQALGDRGLADAGLADQQRVVLAAAAQDLDDALDLVLAADQRIDLAVAWRAGSGSA